MSSSGLGRTSGSFVPTLGHVIKERSKPVPKESEAGFNKNSLQALSLGFLKRLYVLRSIWGCPFAPTVGLLPAIVAVRQRRVTITSLEKKSEGTG
jgi:hypothetical protein